MGLGAKSSLWRRTLFRTFESIYFRRRLKTADGSCELYLSAGSSLRVLDPRGVKVEKPHENFIRDWVTPDTVLWDIGTNLGLFAFPAALKARRGRVYAFEPDIELAANLVRSQRLNRELPLSVLCAAVSDSDGTASFQISRFGRAINKLEDAGKWHEDEMSVAELRPVPTLRIDTLAQTIHPPSVMKIDVEGAEIKVLRGGTATISKYRPTILVEGPRELWDEMGTFFKTLDYVMLDGNVDHPVPVKQPVWDTIAVPGERYSQLAHNI